MPTPRELLEAVTEATKPIAQSITRIEQALHTLATVELAKTLYDRSELPSLINKHGQLMKNDQDAFAAMTKAHDELAADHGSLGWEQRIEKYGMADASAMVAPSQKAREERAATLRALDAFRDEHPIIAGLVDASRLLNHEQN